MNQLGPHPILFSEWLSTGVMVHFEEASPSSSPPGFSSSSERFSQTKYSSLRCRVSAKLGRAMQPVPDRPKTITFWDTPDGPMSSLKMYNLQVRRRIAFWDIQS
jgi:hypothetical protein